MFHLLGKLFVKKKVIINSERNKCSLDTFSLGISNARAFESFSIDFSTMFVYWPLMFQSTVAYGELTT